MAQHLCSAVDVDGERLAGWEVLDALSALIDKSLVQRDESPAGVAGGAPVSARKRA